MKIATFNFQTSESGNLALERETCLSSTRGVFPYCNLSSWLAVDGSLGTGVWQEQCAQTKDPDGEENWFMVDLRQTVGDSRVRVLIFNSTSRSRSHSFV